jgi:uncharacterized membrane protein (DUF106 family)
VDLKMSAEKKNRNLRITCVTCSIFTFFFIKNNTTTKMDSDRQQLAAIEQKIEDLIRQRKALKKLERKQQLTSDEQEELVGLEMELVEAKEDKKYYQELIKIAMKDEP